MSALASVCHFSELAFLGTISLHCRPLVRSTDVRSSRTHGQVLVQQNGHPIVIGHLACTGRMGWMAHRKWKESKQQKSMLPGPAVPGCRLIYFHFLWAIHPIRPVQAGRRALVLFLLFMLYVANVNQFFGKFPNETKLGFTSCS